MLNFLKNHPFAVQAFFKSSVVLTFALPKAQLQQLLPPSLSLDTFKDEWVFLAVAMVQTEGLRPKGFPKIMGNDFFLIGYRVFVRYKTSQGKNLRGLYILKSETNRKKMEFFGNIFTHYNYTTTDIEQLTQGNRLEIRSVQSKLALVLEKNKTETPLPSSSPFADWKEARRFAGPLPFTFTFDSATNQMLIIEGVRENWTPKPIQVLEYQVDFLREMHLENAILANAFIIEDVDYFWKKGKKDLWTPEESPFKG